VGNAILAEEYSQGERMAKSVFVAGVDPSELPWLRILLHLLRHPDPGMPELARQALLYLTEAARERAQPEGRPLDHAG
jgi:hypothetical protein